ncbi:MAG: ABC transporter substrate-binding protein, partial [Candidatus Binatia bacterium]
TSLPWTVAEYEDVRGLMGEDFWPYGFEANRKNLETFHSYLLEQGMIKKPLELETLFTANTLTAFKI